MTLTPQHRDLLEQLVERKGQIVQNAALPIGCEELERAGYITIISPTRGDLSALIVEITDIGRKALAAYDQ
jgi:hypothetical protein